MPNAIKVPNATRPILTAFQALEVGFLGVARLLRDGFWVAPRRDLIGRPKYSRAYGLT